MDDLFVKNKVKWVSSEENEFDVEIVDDCIWDICISIVRIMLYSLAESYFRNSQEL